MRFSSAILLLAALTLGKAANASEEYVFAGITLLQPNHVVEPRLGSANDLATYIRQLQPVIERAFKDPTDRVARSGFVVVAVKPIQQPNFWFDFSPALRPDELQRIELELKKIVPMRVVGGPVVFALRIATFGAKPPIHPMPRPPEWLGEVGRVGQPIETGDMVLRLWRP